MMHPLYTAYRALTSGLFFTCFPPFWIYSRLTGYHSRDMKERLGILPRRPLFTSSKGPRIWIHAASLGEVRVAMAVLEYLKKTVRDCSLFLSTTTVHGKELAARSLSDIPVIIAPLDHTMPVRRSLSTVQPDVMVFLETEIWPTWLMESRRMGIKTALINGRISPRSIGKYLRLRPFFREVLKCMDCFSMISDEDARRVKKMGADPGKVIVQGNAKYDLLASQADPKMEEEMRRTLNLEPNRKVLIAGSTRGGEEAIVLDAYGGILKAFPDTILVIAPRHITRTPEIEAMLRGRGLGYQLRTDLDAQGSRRTERVIIMNTFGELFKLYSVGTIVFCGASLVPLGGQNPMEAAVWGKAVFYGPSMEDFLDAKAILEEVGAGIQVTNARDLSERALQFLSNPEHLKAIGRRARETILQSHGAANKHAEVIIRLL